MAFSRVPITMRAVLGFWYCNNPSLVDGPMDAHLGPANEDRHHLPYDQVFAAGSHDSCQSTADCKVGVAVVSMADR